MKKRGRQFWPQPSILAVGPAGAVRAGLKPRAGWKPALRSAA